MTRTSIPAGADHGGDAAVRGGRWRRLSSADQSAQGVMSRACSAAPAVDTERSRIVSAMIMGTRGSLRSGSISTITKLAAVGSDVAPSSHRHSVSSFRSASSRTPTASDSPGAGKVALYPNNRFHEGGHVVPKACTR